jgi:hypothetical protein
MWGFQGLMFLDNEIKYLNWVLAEGVVARAWRCPAGAFEIHFHG